MKQKEEEKDSDKQSEG